MMTSQEQHNDFEVEQHLRADTSGRYRAELRVRLGDMHDACTLARRQLHDRDTYRRLEAGMAAVGVAVTVLDLMPPAGAAREYGSGGQGA
ncbi:hypothetical protein GCM10023165_34060 [Variovorax defluvii]|uniref:Transcriptional regulator n=1 Tax=Variovorax defluvii TaxID=913761 RepID=A0ABP8I054_9BURK